MMHSSQQVHGVISHRSSLLKGLAVVCKSHPSATNAKAVSSRYVGSDVDLCCQNFLLGCSASRVRSARVRRCRLQC